MDGLDPGTSAVPLTRAVIGVAGPVLRFVETVRDGDGRPRLRRLGAIDFDFDAEQAVFGDVADPDALRDVGAALAGALGGTAATALVVVAHPLVTTAFFTPLPVGLSDDACQTQLHQEAALLADVAPTRAVRVRAAPIRTERVADGERQWFHVVHVEEAAHDRLSSLADGLGVSTYDLTDATRATAAALLATGEPDEPAGVDLVVGAYRTHTEVALCRDGVFRFGHHGPGTTPADTAYFALAALQQAGFDASDAGRLFTYGDDATPERLDLMAEFLGRPRQPLDPFAPFARPVEMPDDERAAFAPVLGASL